MEKQTKDDAYYAGLDKRTNEYKEWKELKDSAKFEKKEVKAEAKTEKKEAKQEAKSEIDHGNPFCEGVTYKSFLKELGDKNIDKHLEGKKCTKEQIAWIKQELKDFNNNKK